MKSFRRESRGSDAKVIAVGMLALICGLLRAEGELALSEDPDHTPADRQTAFRIRGDFSAGLNDDSGWASAVDQPATVTADQPFRIRFEVEAGGRWEPRQFGLQYRRNGGTWKPLLAEDFPYPQKLARLETAAIDEGVKQAFELRSGPLANLNLIDDGPTNRVRVETSDSELLALGRYSIHWPSSEFVAEIRLPSATNARAGVVFEDRGAVGFSYIELVPPDRIRLIEVAGGESRMLAEQRTRLARDQWLELKIGIEGPDLSFELDGETILANAAIPAATTHARLGLFVPEASVAEFRSFAIEGESSTPRTSIISASGFDQGAPTRNLIEGSTRPFAGGAGVSFAPTAPPWTARDQHGEWSFPIVIRRFADEAALNERGERFDYRLVNASGEGLPAAVIASVELDIRDGHLGGTFVETPMRVGPWQARDGRLYFIMEPAETWNLPMVVASSDGGRTWREIDGQNRPETGDLEGMGSAFAVGRIHVLHQVSEAVFYHAFDTADRAENGDRWVIRDELVAAPDSPPTQVADLAVRSDGSVVAVYGDGRSIRLRVRSAEGEWSEEVDAGHSTDAIVSGPSLVAGRDDMVHLAWTASDGSAWYRRIGRDDRLSEPVRIASDLGTGEQDVGALLPLVHLEGSDTVVAIYRAADGRLRERRWIENGSWSDPVRISDRVVVQSAVDSDQVGADAIAVGEEIHLAFIDEATGHLMYSASRGTTWSTSRMVVTDGPVQWVRGQAVRSADGSTVYGLVYDAGSNGGSGRNRYVEIPID